MPKIYLVPPAPPHNEGKTVAAWSLAVLVLLGVVGVSIGMISGEQLILLVGIGLIVLGFIAGFVLRALGMGQKARH